MKLLNEFEKDDRVRALVCNILDNKNNRELMFLDNKKLEKIYLALYGYLPNYSYSVSRIVELIRLAYNSQKIKNNAIQPDEASLILDELKDIATPLKSKVINRLSEESKREVLFNKFKKVSEAVNTLGGIVQNSLEFLDENAGKEWCEIATGVTENLNTVIEETKEYLKEYNLL